MRKPAFEEKKLFFTFPVRKSIAGLLDNFVEQIKLYHNPKVHKKPIYIYRDTELEENTPQILEKKFP
jgi:hypothetical protein